MTKPTIFISYSRKDRRYLDELKAFLAAARDYELDLWDDTMIATGQDFRDAIEVAIKKSRIAVLLVSSDFLQSDFIRSIELPELLARARSAGSTICTVHVRPSLVAQMDLGRLQAVNDPARPLSTIADDAQREVEWANIASKVLAVAQQQTRGQATRSGAAEAYASLAAKLRLYCLKALDLKSAFQFVGDSARYSEGDLEELNGAVRQYNVITEELMTRGEEYVLAAAQLLPTDLAEEVGELLAIALDELHRAYAFQLNEVRIKINHLQRGEVDATRVAAVSGEVQSDMQPLLRGLSDKVPVLQKRIARLAEKVARL